MPLTQQMKDDLAAAYRICAAHGFNEGVCNHLTISFTDERASRGSASLVIAHGWDWSEVTAERLLVFDNHTGKVLEGAPGAELELTAFQIHSALHLHASAAQSHAVVFHTHMPYATALTSLAPPHGRLAMCNQNHMRFHGDAVSYDDEYHGLVEGHGEGRRLAAVLGDGRVLCLRNHGVLVAAATIAEAWDDLYYLERACMNQVLAMQTGAPLQVVDEATCARTKAAQLRDMREGGYAQKHFDAQARIHPPPQASVPHASL